MDNDTSGGDVAEIVWRWRWGERPGLVIVMAAVCCCDGESTFPNLSRFLFFSASLEERSAGGERRPWRLINTTLHLRNGLNEPAVLYLPEPCVGGCEFAPVIDKLCPDLPSLEWSADVILQSFPIHSVASVFLSPVHLPPQPLSSSPTLCRSLGASCSCK